MVLVQSASQYRGWQGIGLSPSSVPKAKDASQDTVPESHRKTIKMITMTMVILTKSVILVSPVVRDKVFPGDGAEEGVGDELSSRSAIVIHVTYKVLLTPRPKNVLWRRCRLVSFPVNVQRTFFKTGKIIILKPCDEGKVCLGSN